MATAAAVVAIAALTPPSLAGTRPPSGSVAPRDPRAGDVGGESPLPIIPVNGVLQSAYPTSRTGAPDTSGIVPPAAQSIVINFDDFDAPCTFAETAPLQDRYANLGVRFSGSSEVNGGAILNECGGFDVFGYSPPNFIGFYTAGLYPTGGRSDGPETIFFDPPANQVQINIGGADGGQVTVSSFDANGSPLGTISRASTQTLSTFVVPGSAVARVVISFTGTILVMDDLAYVGGPSDVDHDGLSDVMESQLGTNPNDPDTDDDGLLDGFEVKYGFDPLVGGDAARDPDGDGLDNLAEQQHGTDPTRSDTDHDGLDDGTEVHVTGTNPLDPDTDHDGLQDGAEVNQYGTDPLDFDTDGGGVGDGDEVNLYGTNPLDRTDDARASLAMVMDNSTGLAVAFDAFTLAVHGEVPSGVVASNFVIGDCAITPDGHWGFSTDFNHQLWVTDLASDPPRPAAGTHVIPISNPGEDVSITQDGRYIVVCDGSAASPVSVVDVAARVERSTFFLDSDCNSVDVCPDNSVLVTSTNSGVARRLVIDAQGRLTDTGERLNVNDPMNVYCSPDSNSGVVLTYFEGGVISFAVHGMTFKSQRTVQTAGPQSGAFAPNGSKFYVRVTPSPILAFDFDPASSMLGGSPLFSIPLPNPSFRAWFGIEQIAVDASSARLYASDGGSLRVFDAQNGAPIATLTDPGIVAPTGVCLPGARDTDGDGLSDDQERARGTDPFDPDSDHDGLLDGFEVRNGFDPLVAGEAHLDPDADGLDNLEEQTARTNPHDADTDDDGLGDGQEVHVVGSDPLDPDSDDDSLRDGADNCPVVSNPTQKDFVHPNGIGDACDDPDHDGIVDAADVCPSVADPGQADQDADGNGDACDPCPSTPSKAACLAVTEDGGSCLESRIDLVPSSIDGHVTIAADASVPPESLRFEVLDSSCAPGDYFVFVLNGYLLGNMAADPSNACSCTATLQTFTVNNASLIASRWNVGGTNTFGFKKLGTSATFSWVRVVVDKHVARETECLMDVGGGRCDQQDLCAAGYSFDTIDASIPERDDLTGLTPVIDVPFAGATLPQKIDISSLEDRAYSLCVESTAADPGDLYASSEDGALATVNLATGAAHVVGVLPLPSSEIEYDVATGRAFEQGPLYDFYGYEFNPATGAAIGPLLQNDGGFAGLEWIGSSLYAARYPYYGGTQTLHILDPFTGTSTLVGPTGASMIGGLAYDAATRTLYGIESVDALNLLTIDVSSGHATPVGSTGISAGSLEFGPDGNLYAGGTPYSSGNLYRIDPATGAATLVGPTGFSSVTGLMLVKPAPKRDCHPFTRHGERTLTVNGAPCGSPPVAAIAGGGASECTSPAGAAVTLDGSASTDPDSTPGTSDDIVAYDWFENFGEPAQASLGSGKVIAPTLPLGTHRVTLRVTDRTGYMGNASSNRTVVDTVPPDLSVAVSPTTLAPPNHRMVDIAATVAASDRCGGRSLVLKSVTSSEPDDAAGPLDGATTGDIQDAAIGTEDLAFRLRAERNGAGSGRTYSVVYRAVDGSGNGSERTATVVVPHDNGGVVDPLSLTVQKSGSAALVQWTPVAGALYYNVIRGDLSQLRDVDGVHRLGPVTCLASHSAFNNASDAPTPAPGHGAFYLVEFNDGRPSSYGSESAGKETVVTAADGACP